MPSPVLSRKQTASMCGYYRTDLYVWSVIQHCKNTALRSVAIAYRFDSRYERIC